MGKRRFTTLIYLFFLVIVVGAFAAIALNEYGVQLMAIGCFGFSLIFLLKLYSIYSVEKPRLPKRLLIQEYGLMALVMALFGLRALRIRFAFVEWVFVLTTLLMVFTYFRYLRIVWQEYKTNKILLHSFSFLYISIMVFFLSLSLTFFGQGITVALGALSFALSLGFVAWYFWNGRATLFKEERVNLFREVFKYINLSPVILVMLWLISIYMGLFQANLIPPIYTGEVPVRYEDLLERSLRGERELINGVPKHEVYWDEYQNFLSQMKEREKQN